MRAGAGPKQARTSGSREEVDLQRILEDRIKSAE